MAHAHTDTPIPPRGDQQPVSEHTEAQLQRLSDRLGVPLHGDLTEREARRRIIMLREAENR
ncbi:hypothetical protein [Pseudooceanicola sp.]|uniref:hypothetical protein n=1 Tax=Pseudooceanicola sp. TaxID=1914328 RepID=UPI00351951C9